MFREQKVNWILRHFSGHIPSINRTVFQTRVQQASIDQLDRIIMINPKDKMLTLVFSLFLDVFSINNFYIGDIIYGIEKIALTYFGVFLLLTYNYLGLVLLGLRLIWGIADIFLTYKKAQKINFKIVDEILCETI